MSIGAIRPADNGDYNAHIQTNIKIMQIAQENALRATELLEKTVSKLDQNPIMSMKTPDPIIQVKMPMEPGVLLDASA